MTLAEAAGGRTSTRPRATTRLADETRRVVAIARVRADIGFLQVERTGVAGPADWLAR
nr:hypothetical protein GCM10017745_49360 [Saccharothrix mutabilis subsp. capreolus]